MRLNVQLMGWVFGCLSFIDRAVILNSVRATANSNNGILALGFAVMVLGYVGLFSPPDAVGRFTGSGQRLADASVCSSPAIRRG